MVSFGKVTHFQNLLLNLLSLPHTSSLEHAGGAACSRECAVDTRCMLGPFAGIVTDVHYADAPAAGTRVYRDSPAKVRDAVATFNASAVDFVVSLGDFKVNDRVCSCARVRMSRCTDDSPEA